jgi:pimeloyl-ACP methyl ester carboxylesterase
MAERVRITGPGGRRLDVELSGPPDGRAVLCHHGTPDAGSIFSPLVEAGAARGLRHVAYSRPGYGESDRDQGRTVGDCAADVAAILDHLGIKRCFTIGTSGGGPHVLACAALLPERTIAAASIAGVAPWPADGLDWLEGMGKENHEEFGAARAGAEQLQEFLDEQAAQLARASADELHLAFGDLLSDVDRAVLTGEFAEFLWESTREGLRNGVWGWFDDDVAFLTDWGFDLGAIEIPVTIWQGAQDRFVPFSHGQWLAAHVSGAHAELRSEHGHLSLAVGAYDQVLDDLLAAGG